MALTITDIWLEFEHIADPDWNTNAQKEFCNVVAKISDGREYAFNVWSYGFFELAIVQAKAEEFELSGIYLLPPDLFVERVDRPTIERALTHWFEQAGEFPRELLVPAFD